ncbi:hypothetical protein [Lunatibacter salilacus]|uniref:hypothetical protein n=1 Tax=Lunatibacter salilacus TaxID=2483804 RepID=UPI00131E85ED|nr:hypothetical protein [Lunatibacter salilacus]
MKFLFTVVLLICVAFTVRSQDSFLDRFTLRQSFQSTNAKAEPAIFTFTKPKEKEASWLLNAAIGVNLLESSNTVLTLNPYFEYHKNTLIDRVQDNWQVGVSSEWQSRKLPQKEWSPIFITAVKYNEDKIKNNTSFQGNFYFTPLFKGKAMNPLYFWIPNNRSNFGRAFQFSYTPYIGLENENRINTEIDASSGGIYRAVFRITSEVSLFPQNELWRGKFEFYLDWQYRNNFRETVADLTAAYHKYFTSSFNYTFFSEDDGNKSAKIGLDYTNGENPTRNFEQQSFYAISLKVKL